MIHIISQFSMIHKTCLQLLPYIAYNANVFFTDEYGCCINKMKDLKTQLTVKTYLV